MTQQPYPASGEPYGAPDAQPYPATPQDPGAPDPAAYPTQPMPAPGQPYPTQPMPAQSQPYPTQPMPAQGAYPTQPMPAQPPYGGQPPYSGQPPYGGQPAYGGPVPPTGPPAQRSNVVLFVIIGVLAAALIALVLWVLLSRDKSPVPPPVSTTSAPAVTTAPPETTTEAPETTTTTAPPSTTTEPPATTTTAPPATTSPTAVAPSTADVGLVILNDTFTDEGMKVTTTIEQVTTTWIPALPVYADTPEGLYKRMIGLRLKADTSQSPYLAARPYSGDFEIVAADGTDLNCTEMLESESQAEYTNAILAALGADRPYSVDYETMIAEGWIICQTASYNDKAFDTPGFTITYTRDEGKTRDGTIVPEFTHSIEVKAP